MSLNWRWEDKIGEATIKTKTDEDVWKEKQISLYEGNALLIFLNEWEEDGKGYYSLHSFLADEKHAKLMLGLAKQQPCQNEFDRPNYKLSKLRINKAKSRNWKKIVNLMNEAFDKIDIELYTE